MEKVPRYSRGCDVSNNGLLGRKCSFVSAAVEQSGGKWELQRPSTTVTLPSPCADEGKESGSWTLLSTLLNKTEAGCSERDA